MHCAHRLLISEDSDHCWSRNFWYWAAAPEPDLSAMAATPSPEITVDVALLFSSRRSNWEVSLFQYASIGSFAFSTGALWLPSSFQWRGYFWWCLLSSLNLVIPNSVTDIANVCHQVRTQKVDKRWHWGKCFQRLDLLDRPYPTLWPSLWLALSVLPWHDAAALWQRWLFQALCTFHWTGLQRWTSLPSSAHSGHSQLCGWSIGNDQPRSAVFGC